MLATTAQTSSLVSPSRMMAQLGLTTPETAFVLPASVVNPYITDPENDATKRPRSSSSTPSPHRHKRHLSLPLHPTELHHEISPPGNSSALRMQKCSLGQAQDETALTSPSASSSTVSDKGPHHHPRQTAEKQTPQGNPMPQTFPRDTKEEENLSRSLRSLPASNPPPDDLEQDPFERRTAYWEGRYEITPVLKYFVRRDHAAETEFSVLGPKVCSMLRTMKYDSFCVTCAHVGYEAETSSPCIIVIATHFSDIDATNIIESIQASPERKHIARAFAYEGKWRGFKVDESLLQQHQKHPQPGCSIGSSAAPESSFSLNCFFRDTTSDNKQIYSLTVHHGVRVGSEPIPLHPEPPITIYQPSRPDHDHAKKEIVQAIEQLESSALSGPSLPANPQKQAEMLNLYKKDLEQHCKIDIKFGGVVASSGFAHTMYNGRTHNEDWAVIAVDQTREGINYLRTDFMRRTTVGWRPHNCYGQYVSGIGDIQLDPERLIRKWGRTTAVTTDTIQLVYSHVKLPGVEGETLEYTVTTKNMQFSARGDSGGPVLDLDNRLIGMVLGGTEGTPKLLKGHERLGEVLCSYITPIRFILERVQEVTNLRLVPVLVDLDQRVADGEEIQWPFGV